jgi:hypothetical protein
MSSSTVNGTTVISRNGVTYQIHDADGDRQLDADEYVMVTDTATGEVRAFRGSGEAVAVQALQSDLRAQDIFFQVQAGGRTNHHDPLIIDLNGDGQINLSGVDKQVVALGGSANYQWGDRSPGAHFRPGLHNVPAFTGTAIVYDADGRQVSLREITAQDQARLQSTQMGFDGASGWHNLTAGQRVEFYAANGQLAGELKQVSGSWYYHWNLYGNGARHEWVAPNAQGVADGILVVDDPNGVSIRDQVNVRSMVSEYDPSTGQKCWLNGQERLAQTVDTNRDGVVSTEEMDAAHIKIWQDNNGNGVVDDGELNSLSHHGIDHIRVDSYQDDTQHVTTAGSSAAALHNVVYTDAQRQAVASAVNAALTGRATDAELTALRSTLEAGDERAQGILRGATQLALGYDDDGGRDIILQFGFGAAGLSAVDVRRPDGSQLTTSVATSRLNGAIQRQAGEVIDTSAGSSNAAKEAVAVVPGEQYLALFTVESDYIRLGIHEIPTGLQGTLTNRNGAVAYDKLRHTDRALAAYQNGRPIDAEMFYSTDGEFPSSSTDSSAAALFPLAISSQWVQSDDDHDDRRDPQAPANRQTAITAA